MIAPGTMETPPLDPDPHAGPPTEEWEQPLGTVRAQAVPRELPPRAPAPRPRRLGGPLIAAAFVAVLGAGGFLAWHLAKGSDSGGSAPGAFARSTPSAAAAGGSSNSATNGAASPTNGAAPPGATGGTASPAAERQAVVAISSVLAFAGRGRSAARHGD
jgi:hypothetical protein